MPFVFIVYRHIVIAFVVVVITIIITEHLVVLQVRKVLLDPEGVRLLTYSPLSLR